VIIMQENASLLKKCFNELGFKTYGGDDAPYIWVSFPGKPSWDSFSEILEKTNIITTPGSGFGIAGDGYVRVRDSSHYVYTTWVTLPAVYALLAGCMPS
jgi:LL-diaminopimelate aminotransferase